MGPDHPLAAFRHNCGTAPTSFEVVITSSKMAEIALIAGMDNRQSAPNHSGECVSQCSPAQAALVPRAAGTPTVAKSQHRPRRGLP